MISAREQPTLLILILFVVTSTFHLPAISQTPALSEVASGPLEAERTELRKSIGELEKKGVGIAPYLQSLSEVETLVKSGGPESEIKSRVDRLSSAVSAQSKNHETLKLAPSASVQSLNQYCAHVQSMVKKKWIPVKGVDDGVAVNVSVDSNGLVNNVEIAKKSKGTVEAQENVKKLLAELKQFGVPPKTNKLPLKLYIDCCDTHGVEVAPFENENKTNFAPYMVDLQRRIKSAWQPPSGPEFKRVTALFKLHQNGSISNARLVSKSGVAGVDAAALLAIKTASPFRPLPAGSPAVVDVSFTFDYRPKQNMRSVPMRTQTFKLDPTAFSAENMRKLEELRQKALIMQNRRSSAAGASH